MHDFLFWLAVSIPLAGIFLRGVARAMEGAAREPGGGEAPAPGPPSVATAAADRAPIDGHRGRA